MRTRIATAWLMASLTGPLLLTACSGTIDGASSSTSSALDATRDFAAGLPTWANSANVRGRLDPSTSVKLQVHLAMHNLDGARAELAAISDPDNSHYGQFLTSAQFASKYGPTDADVAAVRAHLEASGLTITEVPANRAYLAVTGTSAQVEAAFATQLMSYATKDGDLYAPSVRALLPKNISSRVYAVVGLSSIGHVRPPLATRPDTTTVVTQPPPPNCSNYYGQHTTSADPPYGDYQYPFPTVPCGGVLPSAIRHAYGIDEAIDSGIDGRGQTIAFVDASLAPTLLADAQEFAKRHDPQYPLATSQFTQLWGPGATQPVETYWFKEQGLDLEALHAVAPKANIVYVAAQSDADDDMMAALNMIISQNIATVISNSWSDYWDEVGTSAALKQAYEQLAIQAGLKGVGLYFASGDEGDESIYWGSPSPCFPDILPEVTTVGGTSLVLDREGAPLFETGWETSIASRAVLTPDGGVPDGGALGPWTPDAPGSFFIGSGGGTSNNFYAQPTYQQGIVPASLAGINGGLNRVIPDVAMTGDPYGPGLLIGETTNGAYSEFFEAGTSLATPLFTATMALAQQALHKTLGQANPLLYKASRLGAFKDIVPQPDRALDLDGASFEPGDLYTFDYHGPGNTLGTTQGFDNVTGLGAPRAASLFFFLLGVTMHLPSN